MEITLLNLYMILEKNMHLVYYHGSDLIMNITPENGCFYSRLNTPVPTMCFIDGFNPVTDIFYYNFEDALYKKRKREDLTNVINYYDMEYERLNNVIEVSDKYGITYSKNDINQERHKLEKMYGVNINIPEDDLKIFEQWASTQENIRKKTKLPHINSKGNEKS